VGRANWLILPLSITVKIWRLENEDVSNIFRKMRQQVKDNKAEQKKLEI